MYRFSKERFLILAILIAPFVYELECQNCAIPRVVTLSRDDILRRECAQIGTVLANISTLNIQSVLNIIDNPHGLELNLENDKLLVTIKTPFCSKPYGEIASYIDDSWESNIELQVEFNCTDGRSKFVTFVIPINDENTQSPRFEESIYNLTMEPCYNGTHDGTCPLNFESPIIVIDHDRDQNNAFMELYTNQTDLIKITYTDLEIGYKFKDADGNQARGHQMNVYLYLVQVNESFTFNRSSLSFDLIAYNSEPSPNGEHLFGKTTVILTFGEVPLDDPGNSLDPPAFNSNVYYSQVTSLDGVNKGSELEIHPYNISASSNGKLKVIYEIHPELDLFEIEPHTGKVRYSDNLIARSNVNFWDDVKIYDIRAYLKSYGFLYSSVPLLVTFNIKNGNGTESPPVECTPSTTECPPMTTEPSTCPVVTCPTPQPCDGSSTTESGEYSTDNPSFPTTTNPSINSTTTDYPETTEFPETEATETSSLPTTETSETSSTPSTSTTSEEPSVTMPSDGTTEDTSQPPFDTTTTTEIVPTTTTPGQPVYDDTCGNCDIIPQNFTCPSSYEKELYPDPFDCSVFHSCRDDGQGGVIDEQMPCAPGLVFCPKFRTCMYEVDCCNDCEHCDDDKERTCLPSSDPANICKTQSGPLPDPVYCNLFHMCPLDDDHYGHRDCLMECPGKTVWCQDKGKCLWPEECPCEPGKLERPKKCHLCEEKESKFWAFVNRWIDDKSMSNFTNPFTK